MKKRILQTKVMGALLRAMLLAPLAGLGAATPQTSPAKEGSFPASAPPPSTNSVAHKTPCRVGAYYFGMWSPGAFQVIKGFPFKRPDFYLRAETRIQPVYADDGRRITGYVPQGSIPKDDWWMGVRDLWDKERCWPANPSDGRPIVYLLDAKGIVNEKTDAKGKVLGYYEPQGNTIERFIGMLRSEVLKAAGHAPLVVLGATDQAYSYQKPDGSMGTVSALAFADAVTRLAPNRGNDKLREDQQKFGLPILPGFTQNFDERPRYGCIKDPPCLYDPTDSFRKNFQRDLALLKAWMDEQPREESRILSIYAWNEWHEGGIIEPNVRDGARYLDVINTVFCLSRNPCDPSFLNKKSPGKQAT